MKIVISGAAGQLGRLVSEQLLAQLSGEELILVTRTPEALNELVGLGAEVRYGNYDEPASLARAFSGGDRLLMISTVDVGRRVQQHRAALEAAVRAGVQHVVYTSGTKPVAGHPVGLGIDEHRETEEMLARSELEWTVLRNGPYAELQVPLGAIAIRYGKLVSNAGDGRVAPVSRADCAAAAVTVLTGHRFAGQTYEITGPEALSQADIARLLTDVSGRAVRVVPTGDRRLAWGLARLGTPKPLARSIVDLGIATREGYFDVVDPAFEQITGYAPRALQQVLLGHLDELLGSDEPMAAYG